MPPPVDRGAYTLEFSILDRALISDRGIQVGFSTCGEAYKFRERVNKARALDRELNRRIYRDEPDHPMYGRTEYGILITRIVHDPERGRWLCRIEKTDIEEMDIEDIPPPEIEEEGEDDVEGTD